MRNQKQKVLIMPTIEAPPLDPLSEYEQPLDDFLPLDPEGVYDDGEVGSGSYPEMLYGGLACEGAGVVVDDLSVEGELTSGIDAAAMPEGDGRLQDVEAAHEAALQENKIFDAYTEALAEDKNRTPEKPESEEEPAVVEAAKPIASEVPVDRKDDTLASPRAPSPPELIKEAQTLMDAAGHHELIPLNARVLRDPANGNLMIVGDNDVRVLEPLPGGKTRIVEYALDETTGVLTISTDGTSIAANALAGDFAPASISDGNVISLPPGVAREVGFKNVVPVEEGPLEQKIAA